MSPGSKSKRKDRKDHKSTSKSGDSARTTVSTSEEPENLGFLYSIDALETRYDDKNPPRILTMAIKGGNDIARLWFPPNRSSQFKRRRGYLYRWPGEIESEKLPHDEPRDNFKTYDVASVFFQARQDNFLAVSKDCKETDIAGETYGWSQIGFHHQPGFLSMVDTIGEKTRLAAPADDSSWMPQVVPEVYNYDTKNPSAKHQDQLGGLCGKLSLLIAMAAFSAPVSHAETVVSKCFGYKTWEKHGFKTGEGRYQERGVVVTIYLDPEAEGVTSRHLRAFEEGKYGPIIATNVPAPSPSPPSQISDYIYSQAARPTDYATSSPSGIPRSFNDPCQAAPSGFPATGNTAPTYPASQQMTSSHENIYDAEDSPTDDEPEDNNAQ